MKGAIIQNFRGMRALVIHPDDDNRRVLISVLGKLGLNVQPLAPQDRDVLLIDADGAIEGLPQRGAEPCVPRIALIGTEAPSRLARVVRHGCSSHILKPIRSSGVFTALLLAVNEHEQRQKMSRENDVLRQRLAGRRIVTKAVVEMMDAHGIDQDDAYERLRLAAMNRRVPIDDMAREQLAHDGLAKQKAGDAGEKQPRTDRKNASYIRRPNQ
jgi:AmiR/NasT family two-component response regulator